MKALIALMPVLLAARALAGDVAASEPERSRPPERPIAT